MNLRCIDCGTVLTRETAVRLTHQAAMCRVCHLDACRAAEAEREPIGTHQVAYVPDPTELRQRVELARAAIGSSPRSDAHGIGDAVRGTALYEPQAARVAGWRRRRERSHA